MKNNTMSRRWSSPISVRCQNLARVVGGRGFLWGGSFAVGRIGTGSFWDMGTGLIPELCVFEFSSVRDSSLKRLPWRAFLRFVSVSRVVDIASSRARSSPWGGSRLVILATLHGSAKRADLHRNSITPIPMIRIDMATNKPSATRITGPDFLRPTAQTRRGRLGRRLLPQSVVSSSRMVSLDKGTRISKNRLSRRHKRGNGSLKRRMNRKLMEQDSKKLGFRERHNESFASAPLW